MVNKNKKTLILLDVHAIIHRAYHALPDFTSGTGEPTGALYGLSAMLFKIIRELKPDSIIACYDVHKPTFRHKVYKEYKAGRKKTDGELVNQIKRSEDIFNAFNIPIYKSEGFEADDVIGTITDQAKKDKNIDIIIASGDMDTLQLVDGKKVRVYTLKKGINDTILYDEEKVKERFGFPPELLPDYKGLRGDPSDNIIGIAGIGEKTGTILIQKFGTLENLYKKLKKNRELFEKAGLKERMIKLLEENKEEALFSKELAQIRLDAPVKYRPYEKKWAPDKEKSLKMFSELGFRSLTQRLKTLFPEDSTNIVDSHISVEEEEVEHTAIALWLIDSNTTNPNLDDILDYAQTDDFKKAQEMILKKLKADNLEKIYKEIELPLVPILKKVKKRGVLIDIKFLKQLSKRYHKELEKLEKEIWKLAGEEFNINSPKQLGDILFDRLEIKGRVKKTSTGAKSTRASELEKLKGEHPIINKLLSYREFQKLLSTYIDNIPDMVDKNKRLHTNFIQTGTTTGRFASQNPNLQNIPVKTELGRNIRKAFVAEKGYQLVAFDYSQVELRVAALLSGDRNLNKIFKEGDDVHTGTASLIFGVLVKDVTKDMRRIAKIINFGIIYGMGVNALRSNLDTTKEKAQQFYIDYFATFFELAEHLENTKHQARERGYTETFFGRRRYLPGLKSPLPYIRAMEERMALNAPIQGTSSDIIKIAMVNAERALSKAGLLKDTHLILQIHDELIYETKDGVLNKASKIIKKEMESVIKESQFIVDVSQGSNWSEMKKIKI